MATIETNDQALDLRHQNESLQAFLSSSAGKRLLKQMDQIQDQSIKGALMGDTPENTNNIMERRGAYRAVETLKGVFKDIEKDNDDAVAWMKLNQPSVESAPADTSEGEEVNTESKEGTASEE